MGERTIEREIPNERYREKRYGGLRTDERNEMEERTMLSETRRRGILRKGKGNIAPRWKIDKKRNYGRKYRGKVEPREVQ